MDVRLTQGAIEAIAKGNQLQNPILQVVSTRRIESANGPPRYRLLMSDGVHSLSSFMLGTQLNSLLEEELIAVNCICLIKKQVINTLKDGRRVVIILDLDVVKTGDVTGRIGDPVPYTEGQSQMSSTNVNNPTSKPLQQRNSYASEASTNRVPAKEVAKPKAIGAPPNTPGGSQSKVVPIAGLNPYQSKWTIRARVTNKSAIRSWSNSRGDGKLFSMEVVDESGEIRITGFNEQVDKFFSLIEINKVYYISKGTLKIANKQYTSVKNDYEMTLNNETSIVPCDDAMDVPMVQFEFIPIGELENKEKDSVVDIIGVCKSYDDVTKITTKSSREVSKRAIHLIDRTGKVITTTLWGEEAERFDGSSQPVVAIKGARLSDFGGRSLSVLFSSTLLMNPDIPEAFKLRGWFDSEGHALEGTSMSESRSGTTAGGSSNWKSLMEVKSENLGHGEKADYYTSVATVMYLRKENCLYQACPTQDCNKKVVDQQNGFYRCEKCDKEFPNFKYRLILSANIADFGDNQWVTCFQEAAEAILGQNAAYLGELRDSNEQAFEEVFQNANFRTYIFRNRVKLETYNDESRIKATVLDVKPIDHKEYSKRLIMNIRKLAV
ncbi:replication protein A 70 kDa DNA-binding subunit [Polypterus senegalus]|uniref:replication protein A 70 kDa DNA-binding subunit n=1 Tax=Polypterus senegalus TaxID=55291 RepID=UPI001963D311|nr:replication protein A 70 kDa DNA-binding subunit [Polypterus senegalus]